jgi:hypothetical protein
LWCVAVNLSEDMAINDKHETSGYKGQSTSNPAEESPARLGLGLYAATVQITSRS